MCYLCTMLSILKNLRKPLTCQALGNTALSKIQFLSSGILQLNKRCGQKMGNFDKQELQAVAAGRR